MEEELLLDNHYNQEYIQFLQEQQLRDINLLTELPEDYEVHIEYYNNTKLATCMNNLVTNQTLSYPS